jgi:hypothetical protein
LLIFERSLHCGSRGPTFVIKWAIRFSQPFNFEKIMATATPKKSNPKRKEFEAKKKTKRLARRAKQAASLKERRVKKREAKKAKEGEAKEE